MHTMTRRMVFGAMLGVAATGMAGAQGYPTRAITVVIPFAGGSASEVVSRIMLDKMSKSLGQPIVVENRPGAGGAVGTAVVKDSPPDGYTILISGTSSLAINPALYKKLPYDPLKDFTPVSLVGTAPSLLVMHPSVPIKTVKDLIALAPRPN